MQATRCLNPLVIVRVCLWTCANRSGRNQDGAQSKSEPEKRPPGNFAGHFFAALFHLKLSAEAGAMFVSALIVVSVELSS